ATVLLALSSCARNQHLVSIQVVPPGATFEGVGAAIQFKAVGTYIHPPETKDITDQVQWSIDSQNLATVSSTGLVTATSICGSWTGCSSTSNMCAVTMSGNVTVTATFN